MQDWEPTGDLESGIYIAETVVNFDRSNESAPTAPEIILKIKDVFDVPRDQEYSRYVLITNLRYGFGNNIHFLNPNCYKDIGILGNNKETELYENGLEYNFTPEFQYVNLMSNGSYEFIISFIIIGLPVGSTVYEILDGYKHYLKLEITEGTPSAIVGSPYEEGEKAFTLDPKFFNIKSYNTETYFQFDAIVKVYDFNNELTQFIIPQKVILYNTIAKMVLGRTIHRLMKRFDSPNTNGNQYKFASLTIVCTEKRMSDDSDIRSQTISDIPYIAGLSRGISDLGFLDFNVKPNRVTVNSFAFLNFIVPTIGYEIRVLRNTILHETISFTAATDKTLCKKVLFNDFTPGDVIDYVLLLSTSETNEGLKKTYIVLPEGKYSNMIVWENEFLLQSAIECTGTAQIKPEGEFQSQKTYNLFVEVLNHISSSKEVKLFINTGWLTKNDIDTVESLMRSKRAWLVRGDEVIQLRSVNKALPPQDTETELIQFPLEFIINRNYDEETYTL